MEGSQSQSLLMGSKRSPPPKGLRKPANAPSIGKPGGAKPPILAASLTTSLIPAKSRLELHKLILPCTPRVPIFCQLSPFHAAIVEKFKDATLPPHRWSSDRT